MTFERAKLTDADQDSVWTRSHRWLEQHADADSIDRVGDTLRSTVTSPWSFHYQVARSIGDSIITFQVRQLVNGTAVDGDNANIMAAYLATGDELTALGEKRARARSAIYIELGGQSIVTSLNYELYALPWLSARVGVGYGLEGGPITVPVALSIRGPSAKGVEISAGVTWTSDWADKLKGDTYFPALLAAFRSDPVEGGLMYRISVGNAWFLAADDTELLVGVAVGYVF